MKQIVKKIWEIELGAMVEVVSKFLDIYLILRDLGLGFFLFFFFSDGNG